MEVKGKMDNKKITMLLKLSEKEEIDVYVSNFNLK